VKMWIVHPGFVMLGIWSSSGSSS